VITEVAFYRVGIWNWCGKSGAAETVFSAAGKKYMKVIAYWSDIHLDRSE